MNRRVKKAAKGLAVAGAVVGAGAAINAALASRGDAPGSELQGKQCLYDWRLGRIWYTLAGEGAPLLLVHGLGIGSSSAEWRRNFAALSGRFQVYALDLLGFGLSDRPAMDHSGRFYVQLLDDFIQYVIKRPANVVASAQSGTYAIRLSYTRPERIRSLVAICPPGLGKTTPDPSRVRLSQLLKLPLIGESIYYALTARANLARRLRETLYYDPGLVTEPMIDRYYASCHQPNDRHILAALLNGELDLDVTNEVKAMKQPLLLAWGAGALYSPTVNARAFQELNGMAIVHLFQEARQFPHDEKAEDFNRLVTSWLEPITEDQLLRVLA